MKNQDFPWWEEIPNTEPKLFSRHFSGKEALEEINKRYSEWLLEFKKEREGSEHIETSIIVSAPNHPNHRNVALIIYWSDTYTLYEFRHNGTIAGLSEAYKHADTLKDSTPELVKGLRP